MRERPRRIPDLPGESSRDGLLPRPAAALCRATHMPVLEFDMRDPGNIARAVQGEAIGTLVSE